jgi:hypothetical protein
MCLQALMQDHLSENIKKIKNKIKKDERKEKLLTWKSTEIKKKKKIKENSS